ncbi:MAG TPA: hypothetical protein VEV87_04050, partial [Chitinophagaceae bacterium]|nr:hypothetical protein [Chitinophagaceae bacterium]
MKRYRYPGITPFSEGDQHIYWGRKDDILKVFNSIALNQSTVLVGRSGVGKTSLIYAGVLPMIHSETKGKTNDNRCFDDIQIRIGIHTKGEEISLNQKIKKLINGQEVTETFLDFLPSEFKSSLWYEFKRLQFRNRKSKDAHIFLLIFDQLEELFTYPYEQFRDLLKELKDLISANLPDDIRQCIEKMERQNPDLLTDEEVAILYKTIPIKFLFAVRSDKLSLAIRLRASIESILQNPIELRPLSAEQAYEAIKKPALETDGDFITEPFEIEDEAVKSICTFLSNL